MKLTINTKIKIISTLLLAFIAITAILLLIIFPTVKDIKDINNKIIEEKESLELKFSKGQYLKNVVRDFKTIEPEIKNIQDAYVTKGKELDFISDMEKISDRLNLDTKINKTKQEQDKENEYVEVLTIEMELSGGFSQTMRFLEEIETLPYYFNIDNIIVASTDPRLGKIITKLAGKVFIKPNYEAQN